MAGMSRRHFLARSLVFGGGLCLLPLVRAETYLSVEQAQQLIYPGQTLRAVDVELTRRPGKGHRESLEDACAQPEA